MCIRDRYNTRYTRDKLGRITQLTETINGDTTTYDYSYDLAGRLEEVKTDSVTTALYQYDSNSNRTHLNGNLIASYDQQDRQTQYGNNQYSYNDNGELQQKTNTATNATTDYDYDVLGNLRTVTQPQATRIEYVIDGQNRRIGKKIDGSLVQGLSLIHI